MEETKDVPVETPLVEEAAEGETAEAAEATVEENGVEEKAEEKVEAAPAPIKTTSSILEFCGAVDTYVVTAKEQREKAKAEKTAAAAAEKEEETKKRKDRIERFGTEEEKARLRRMERFGVEEEQLEEPAAKRAKKGGKTGGKGGAKGAKSAPAKKEDAAPKLSAEDQAAKEARMKRFA